MRQKVAAGIARLAHGVRITMTSADILYPRPTLITTLPKCFPDSR
jgi:hypothetical protein